MAENRDALAWIVGGDTGTSSTAIWATMTGVPVALGWSNHPRDPDDIGRCFRLLALVPEWRERLPEMAAVSPQWAALVGHWPELEALWLSEGDGTWRPPFGTIMHRLYGRMGELLDASHGTPASEGGSDD